MNAKKAKEQASAYRKKMDEDLALKKSEAFKLNVDILLKHFHDKIENAVKQGKFSTDEMTFAVGRFPNDVLTEVTHQLKKDGFTLNTADHNAYKTIKFIVSWDD